VSQEFAFNGVRSLKLLNLANNRIATIGLNVFTAKAELVSLNDINLDGNKLTELEPWPFVRGQLVPGSTVNLYKNSIVNFTNQLGWSFRCGMKNYVNMTLELGRNPFGHLTDLMDGWNVTGNHMAI